MRNKKSLARGPFFKEPLTYAKKKEKQIFKL